MTTQLTVITVHCHGLQCLPSISWHGRSDPNHEDVSDLLYSPSVHTLRSPLPRNLPAVTPRGKRNRTWHGRRMVVMRNTRFNQHSLLSFIHLDKVFSEAPPNTRYLTSPLITRSFHLILLILRRHRWWEAFMRQTSETHTLCLATIHQEWRQCNAVRKTLHFRWNIRTTLRVLHTSTRPFLGFTHVYHYYPANGVRHSCQSNWNGLQALAPLHRLSGSLPVWSTFLITICPLTLQFTGRIGPELSRPNPVHVVGVPQIWKGTWRHLCGLGYTISPHFPTGLLNAGYLLFPYRLSRSCLSSLV